MITRYHIEEVEEFFFECYLGENKRIDVPLYSLDAHLAVVEPELNRVLKRYETYEECVDFLKWAEIDLTPYLDSYLEKLCFENNGTLRDLIWTYRPEEDDWYLED